MTCARSRPGFECGVTLEDFNALEVGDIIETYSRVRV